MNDNTMFFGCFCVVAAAIVSIITVLNLKDERLEKEYVKNGYQQVWINNSTTIWQKVPQPEAK